MKFPKPRELKNNDYPDFQEDEPTLLKVPKREIFDRSDFPDFYTIKSLWEGDFRVRIKCLKKIFRGSFGAAKFLTRMLSLILRRDFF